MKLPLLQDNNILYHKEDTTPARSISRRILQGELDIFWYTNIPNLHKLKSNSLRAITNVDFQQ